LGYFFLPALFGRCVSAEPAAVLAALDALGLRKTLEAAVAAFLLVTSPFLAAIDILLMLMGPLSQRRVGWSH
jgi:hypothetical protein